MRIEVRQDGFDPWSEVAAHQERSSLSGRFGATAVFVGTMRDMNEGDVVRAMTLEHYPEMTGRYLDGLARRAAERWDLMDVLVLHRMGSLEPGDPIVLVAVWSAHRAAAFEACRHIMEELKSRAPFWKKEALEAGERWVEKNTPG